MRMKKWMVFVIAGVMVAANTICAFGFGSHAEEAARGRWTDTNNLTWTYWGGESIVIGAGPKFSDVHPEIDDPEHFLKESICYPGEAAGTLNSQGQPKACYTEGSLLLLQEFVNSFDWIHSDEVTRLKKVYDRIANGRNGNTIGSSDHFVSFSVLQNRTGLCGNYSWEFVKLCNFVGLECVSYGPSPLHSANMVNINGQWITVDTYLTTGLFDNGVTVPVDFDLEYNRYQKEFENSETYKQVMDGAELDRKVQAGEITWKEYYMAIYPDLTVEEIKELYRNNGVELEL